MARIKAFHRQYIHPVGKMVASSATLNHRLWTSWFGEAWGATPLDEKLIWLMFVSYTISVLTIIELLFLRH